MINKYTDDDYCDLYPNKICDNCGKCLEEQGIDIRAIKIEDISKNIEENQILEEEWKEMITKAQNLKPDMDKEDLEKALKEAYSSLNLTSTEELNNNEESEYIDAFDKIEYLDDCSLNEESGELDELTEEVFPGVRRIVRKNRS